ncbi:hypothetical protein [Haloarchaeobius sp. HME9146]|uniref:hypothetical protein n=1 Tax=Haloarchaeobius sp. HME9146 TaxID=2978732 RepID=UPI0021C17F4A|nr:hypothetical protein [Haloarchaeobius sp. HME9146]MCT9094629.1 hypothetical protein [Haloarchaeobius sp. HME9146]
MSNGSATTGERLLVFVGAIFALFGSYQAWARTNPETEVTLLIRVYKMEPGLGPLIWPVVLLTLIAVGMVLVGRRDQQRWVASGVAGLFTLTATLLYAVAIRSVDVLPPQQGMFVPTVWWYVAVLGGLMLAANGLGRLVLVRLSRTRWRWLPRPV